MSVVNIQEYKISKMSDEKLLYEAVYHLKLMENNFWNNNFLQYAKQLLDEAILRPWLSEFTPDFKAASKMLQYVLDGRKIK